jgi:pimeloyl-ACP methyl ester carboxylesterase
MAAVMRRGRSVDSWHRINRRGDSVIFLYSYIAATSVTSSPMSKPTIVCVPGAWHTPEIYAKVLNILSGYGYPTLALALPSAGASPPHADFNGDVEGIRECLTELVEEGKDVVLVMHSYTGMPGAQAPAGLDKKERQAANLKGGVIRLVFIMAFAMPEGFTPTAGGAQYPEWMKMDPDVCTREHTV